MLRPAATALSLAAALSACTMEPKYQRPDASVPSTLPQGGAYAPTTEAATAAPDLPWREFFTDLQLQKVIQLALDNNRDLRVSTLNIAQAHAQYRIQRAALFPEIDGATNGTIEHLPGAVLGAQSGVGATGTGAAAALNNSSGVTLHYFTATLGVSNYELDLWGRVRSLSHQALEQYLSTTEARRAQQISLISQVATEYVTYAADLDRLNLAKETTKADQASFDLTQARFNGGVASDLDVRQAESALGQAQAGVATYTTTVAQDLDALRLLVGADVPAELLPAPLGEGGVSLADLPAGMSSDVLLRRPDVMEAEHTLKAYNANIGAARAAFFPQIKLTGTGGSAALNVGDLFTPGTGAWTFTPSITLPIFDEGRNAANLRSAKVQRDIAVAQYQKSIQTAFREVADALAQRGQIDALVAADQRAALATGRSLTLSGARYQRGSDTYLNVLTAQVTQYSARQTLITARLTRQTNLITLYQALGGGVR